MQIKITVRYHFTLAKMTLIKRWTVISVDKNMEKWKSSHVDSGTLNCAAILENSLAFPQKVKHSVTIYDPEVTLLGIYSREMKTYVHTKSCIQMSTAVLFIIVKKWEKPKYPSTDE